MTPIPFDLPSRILPPTTAYAAGLVCELRPDLADPIREAVLGDAALTALDVLTFARVEAGDEQGARALGYLREIVHYGGNDPKALHGLADVLGLIRECPDYCVWCEHPDGAWLCLNREDPFIERAGLQRSESIPPLGATWAHPCGPGVFGIPRAVTSSWRGEEGAAKTRQTAAVWQALTTSGFAAAWALLPHKTLWSVRKWVIAVTAHTVSLDADTRAAWAKAHLDALADPIRPQSPDRLN